MMLATYSINLTVHTLVFTCLTRASVYILIWTSFPGCRSHSLFSSDPSSLQITHSALSQYKQLIHEHTHSLLRLFYLRTSLDWSVTRVSSKMTQLTTPDEGFTVQAVGGIIGGILFLLVSSLLIGLVMRRQKRKRYQKRIEEATAKSTISRP
ncbi:hypothetical protein K491DRAFT_234196 [Lophiostoma macrostomum CBS 122681]|uniref:Epidermal growth factor receptor-like transmembrane-juxtamembrane segment domain-containing protein n=1 Tax=Lophiostoma macrostomum CBS 122681 TaxID=1314788 RepID=A0A6A6TGI4_9PLEO|nr:hypothetical protein K491DRAFT_234196 [Lophiostoma macrostomum CBS 122681]